MSTRGIHRDTPLRAGAITGLRSSSATSGMALAQPREPVEKIGQRVLCSASRRTAVTADRASPPCRSRRAPGRPRPSAARSGRPASPISSATPARPEGDERPEDRILGHAGEQPMPSLRHRLDRHRGNRSARRRAGLAPRPQGPEPTPPVSVLWAPGTAVLTATGKPRSDAAATASSSEPATRSGTSDMPYAPRSDRASSGVSQLSAEVESAVLMTDSARSRSIPSTGGIVPARSPEATRLARRRGREPARPHPGSAKALTRRGSSEELARNAPFADHDRR